MIRDNEFYKYEEEFNYNKKNKEKASANFAKEKIKKKAKISIETATIGSLSDFEEIFGWLWAHGEKYESLTLEQKKMRDKWMEVRNSILDRGNNSKKLLLREIEKCVFKDYVSNRYDIIIKNPEERNGRSNY